MAEPVKNILDSETRALKIPPHSIEAEQAVLGGIFLDRDAWIKVSERLTGEDFYRQDHRLIFNALCELESRGKPHDIVTVAEWLESTEKLNEAGGLQYLADLADNTPSASNIAAYADIVRKRSVLRQLIRAAGEISESVFSPSGRSSEEILEYAEQIVFQIAEQEARGRKSYRPIKELLARALDRVDELFQSKSSITGLATGFDDLDDKTGGLQRSDLIVIAGRPSMGKTSLAINIAEHAAIKNQRCVAIFTMEMPGEQLAMRMMASLGRIDQQKIRTGRLKDDDWPRLTHCVSLMQDTKMFVDDTPALTPAELRSRCRRIARESGLDLVVVDYLQLMQVPGTVENRATEISEISRSLKAMAKELNIPVIALSQLNRSVESRPDKRPVMSDLRECVAGDTLAMLADGRRLPVRELVGQANDVLSLSERGLITAGKATAAWPVGSKLL
ncbi:MAG: replicative DNA helicase, partial [Gammaproteobacteria bacterium]